MSLRWGQTLLWLAASACSLAIERTPEAAPSLVLPACIAVAPFESPPQIPLAGEVVATALAEELHRTGRHVVGPAEVTSALDAAQARLQQLGRLEVLGKIGEELGVTAVLAGTVTRFAHAERSPIQQDPVMVAFSARLIDVSTGQVLWGTAVSASDRPYLLSRPRSRAHVAQQAVVAAIKEWLAEPGPMGLAPCRPPASAAPVQPGESQAPAPQEGEAAPAVAPTPVTTPKDSPPSGEGGP